MAKGILNATDADRLPIASTPTESGHVQNVVNFEELLSIINEYGATYNPSQATIMLASMKKLCYSAIQALNVVSMSLPSYNLACSAREVAFEPLSKVAFKLLICIKSNSTSDSAIKSATTLVRKITGRKITPTTYELSSHPQNHEARANSFEKLIKLVSALPNYQPNDNNLELTSLTCLLNKLKEQNATVKNAKTVVCNAQAALFNLLYKPISGVVDVACDAKYYIKTLYGSTSPQYQQVCRIEFRTAR